MQVEKNTNLGVKVRISEEKVLNKSSDVLSEISKCDKVLVTLVAGKGTRFGTDPKCIQSVNGLPLARHSIDAFKRISNSPVISIVGYKHEEVVSALGPDNLYILTDNPAGGTAFAAIEAFCVSDLLKRNPLVIITMGDRIIPSSIFRQIISVHGEGLKEADLTFLSAVYEPPKNIGKGRVIRNEKGKVLKILEEKDIISEQDTATRKNLLNLMEGNCPLYVIRAAKLFGHLTRITNSNAQGQYYLTDIIESISNEGGEIRTLTTSVNDPEYDFLTSDVTQPMDLALLEGIFANRKGLLSQEEIEIQDIARQITAGRPKAQIESIIRQTEELMLLINREKISFDPGRPLGIGITGGRLRIAFMHPDMARFFGPAWQMPIGAGKRDGDEQILILVQSASDSRIHLVPINYKYRENINSLPADNEIMYPGEEISDMATYERFGTKMSENLLLSLGYFSDEELETRRERNQPLPPPSLWVTASMRRPFALVGNAIASIRTLRSGNIGAKVNKYLGIENFRGLKMVSAGNIPQGGFSSSSAVTVATKNAINALFDLGIPTDLLVHLACQAEYGTGVRAGSLDQATEQKGMAGQGTLISSNPVDNYKILGTYPIPDDRIQIIFPYSVERDRDAWKWSGGLYAENAGSGVLTTTQIRKMTGKAAEIAAILVKLPLETDFFKYIEEDLIDDGLLSDNSKRWICKILIQLPLFIKKDQLHALLMENKEWYAGQLTEVMHLEKEEAAKKADKTFEGLFDGWSDPVFRITDKSGNNIQEHGVPLRAMVAYLFAEVAKNFFMIHNQDQWIECVTLSQRGDCCYSIEPGKLPPIDDLMTIAPWEKEYEGHLLMNEWLKRYEARPFDFNNGIRDIDLNSSTLPEFHRLQGSGFFRGLALIDLVEAMLKRAFGNDSVAVRVNAAGQGDYFQVHIDRHKTDTEKVKDFIRQAVYKRFGLSPDPDFVEIYSGGGAVGVRLSRFDHLSVLLENLKMLLVETR